MPKSILSIAKGMYTIYNDVFSAKMDQMKMHKLLYFAQKYHYKTFGEWLFDDNQEGWVHGPVNKEVRDNFCYFSADDNVDITLEEEYTIREIVHEYGMMNSWQLRNLSHEDSAYKNSRIGLGEYDIGNRVITKGDIFADIISDSSIDDSEVLH